MIMDAYFFVKYQCLNALIEINNKKLKIKK